jgi:uncharacterized RDD family membrane protein YckC
MTDHNAGPPPPLDGSPDRTPPGPADASAVHDDAQQGRGQQGYGPPAAGPPSYGPPAYGQQPYPQPGNGQPAYPQTSGGQSAYGQQAYPQPGNGQPAYGQQAYPQTSGGPPGDGQHTYVQPGYGQQTFAQPGYGHQGNLALAPGYAYAEWGPRVGAYLIDFIPTLVGQFIFFLGYAILIVDVIRSYETGAVQPSGAGVVSMVIGGTIILASTGWQIYNRWIIAGRTGQSLGKRKMKIALLSEVDGQPIGPLNAFLRDLAHILDSFACVGYLWPLWDDRKQTFSDKITRTMVVTVP